MNTTTDAHPQPVHHQGPRDDDALLHGKYIGSFPSELQAWTDLNRVSFAQSRHGVAAETAVSTSDQPAAVAADPDDESSPLPVPGAALEAAATRLRPDPAITKALTRLLDGGWTYRDDDPDDLVIRFDPRSKGRGKKPPRTYITKRDSCTCPGAIIRGGCYHPLAWQIVNEALLPTTTIQCSLSAALFVPLCRLALSSGADHVTFTADSGRGTLTLGAPDLATGTIHVAMATTVLLTITQQLRATDLTRVIDALADALPPGGAHLTLDFSAESLLIIAGTADAPLFLDGLDTLPIAAPTAPSA
jgi:hypothetical protein